MILAPSIAVAWESNVGRIADESKSSRSCSNRLTWLRPASSYDTVVAFRRLSQPAVVDGNAVLLAECHFAEEHYSDLFLALSRRFNCTRTLAPQHILLHQNQSTPLTLTRHCNPKPSPRFFQERCITTRTNFARSTPVHVLSYVDYVFSTHRHRLIRDSKAIVTKLYYYPRRARSASAWILFSLWMYVCMFVCLYVCMLAL